MEPRLNDIPQTEWPPLLDKFSRAHHDEPVEFVIIAPDSGKHQEARQLPLLGVSTEQTERGLHITIMAGGPEIAHISHEISHPKCLRFAEWNDGASARLEIESDDGYSAALRVGPAQQSLPPGSILNGNYQKQ